jgi:hypothetical protein
MWDTLRLRFFLIVDKYRRLNSFTGLCGIIRKVLKNKLLGTRLIFMKTGSMIVISY